MRRIRAAAHLLVMLLLVSSVLRASDIVYRVRNETVHTINPRLFGQFMERPSWGEIGPEGALVPGTHKLQPAVIKLLREMEIPIIRFPGGTDVDFLDWWDMVDNVPGRGKSRPVSIGHDGDSVTNNFGYDEFLSLCRQLKAEPIIVVNFRDGLLEKKPLPEAARHAAGLVAYCNAAPGVALPEGMPDWPSIRAMNGHPEPYGVKYWQIGNETWAFFKQLKEMHPQDADRYYADCVIAFARAMLAVDPGIEFIVDGAGPTQTAADMVRRQLGGKLGYTVFHIYKPWGISEVLRDGAAVVPGTLTDSDVWNAWVAMPYIDDNGLSVINHRLITEARRDGFKLAVTEWNWNGWWRARPSPLSSSYAKGVGAAGFIHGLMRAADVIEIGCQSMLVGNSWGIHAIWADRDGIKAPRYMPTGQVTMLYSQHHGSKLLKLESSGILTYVQPFWMNSIEPSKKVAYLDALATRSDSVLYFHVINRHFEQSFEITLDLSGMGSFENKAGQFMLEGRLNDSPAPGEPDQIAEIDRTGLALHGNTLKVLLPARTVSCIELYFKK